MRFKITGFPLVLMLCCLPLLAGDTKTELDDSPAYLEVIATKPDNADARYTKPTGKFKVLADYVIRQLKAADATCSISAWTVAGLRGRPGLIIIYPAAAPVRIDDTTCSVCPCSTFAMPSDAVRPPWFENALIAWTRLDQGWHDKLGHAMLKTSRVTKTGDGTWSVEFSHQEVKHYLLRRYWLTQR